MCDAPACRREGKSRAGRAGPRQLDAKRKRCSACLKVKPLTAEHWYTGKRDPETGAVLRFDGMCKLCKRADQAARYRSDERRRKLARERARRQRERRAEIVRSDPAEAERIRARERAWCAEARQRRRERRNRPEPVPGFKGREVPVAPIAAVLSQMVERYRAEHPSASQDDAATAAQEIVAERAGVTTRRIRKWLTEADPQTRFDVADEVLQRLDLFWWDVYDPERFPHLYSPLRWLEVVDIASREWEGEALLGIEAAA